MSGFAGCITPTKGKSHILIVAALFWQQRFKEQTIFLTAHYLMAAISKEADGGGDQKADYLYNLQ